LHPQQKETSYSNNTNEQQLQESEGENDLKYEPESKPPQKKKGFKTSQTPSKPHKYPSNISLKSQQKKAAKTLNKNKNGHGTDEYRNRHEPRAEPLLHQIDKNGEKRPPRVEADKEKTQSARLVNAGNRGVFVHFCPRFSHLGGIFCRAGEGKGKKKKKKKKKEKWRLAWGKKKN
jgi:hypothetical protein